MRINDNVSENFKSKNWPLHPNFIPSHLSLGYDVQDEREGFFCDILLNESSFSDLIDSIKNNSSNAVQFTGTFLGLYREENFSPSGWSIYGIVKNKRISTAYGMLTSLILWNSEEISKEKSADFTDSPNEITVNNKYLIQIVNGLRWIAIALVSVAVAITYRSHG